MCQKADFFFLIFRSLSPERSKHTDRHNQKDDKKSSRYSHYETEKKFERKNTREKCIEDNDYSYRKRKEVPQEESRSRETRDDYKDTRKYDDAKKIKKEIDIKQEKHSPLKCEKSHNATDRLHQTSSKRKRDQPINDNGRRRKSSRECDIWKHNTTTDIDNFRYI